MKAFGFSPISHTADLGLEAWGPSFEAAIGQAVLGTFALMGTPTTRLERCKFESQADGVDEGDLVVRVLSEMLANLELEGRYVTQVEHIDIDPPTQEQPLYRARLGLLGHLVDRDRERGLVEFKAVTYHDLLVERGPDVTRVRVV